MRSLLLTTSLLGWVFCVNAASEPELLPVEEAFQVSASISGGGIQVNWEIADGYYMYQDRYGAGISEAPAGFELGEPQFSEGKQKTDDYFGTSTVYFENSSIALPYSYAAQVETRVRLELAGQGCNEPVGVCYPPYKTVVDLVIPAATAAEPDPQPDSQPQQSPLGNTFNPAAVLGTGSREFLPVDDAFRPDVFTDGGRLIRVRIEISDGYYLYRQSLKLESPSPDIKLIDPDLPDGVSKQDEYFGQTVVYYESASFAVPVASTIDSSAEVFLSYQGCAENGICYPPQKRSFLLETLLPDALAQDTVKISPTHRTGFWGFVFGAFGIGFLLTFTPCVLPMVPILSGVIAGDRNPGRGRAGLLSVVYVLGTAVTYTAAGAVAGATGEQLQAYFQNPFAIGAMVIVLVAMALSMFGLYEIQMPSFLQSVVQTRSARMGGGRLIMVFVLGAVSALIVGACVSPLLISALGVAIVRGDPVLGAAIMFAIAMGMGVILVAFGFGAGSLLPRAGAWMDKVKKAFGVLLIAVAIYLLGVLPSVPVLLIWGTFFIVLGVYLGATQAVRNGSGWLYLSKGVGTVFLIWGVLALIGGFWGQRDILNPIPRSMFAARDGAQPHTPVFQRVSNVTEFDEKLAEAVDGNRNVILDYYADWCIDCVRMERTTFSDARVLDQIKQNFTPIQVDVTDPNAPGGKALKKRFGVFGPPALLFFDKRGQEIESMRLYGYRDVNEFVDLLNQVNGS